MEITYLPLIHIVTNESSIDLASVLNFTSTSYIANIFMQISILSVYKLVSLPLLYKLVLKPSAISCDTDNSSALSMEPMPRLVLNRNTMSLFQPYCLNVQIFCP